MVLNPPLLPPPPPSPPFIFLSQITESIQFNVLQGVPKARNHQVQLRSNFLLSHTEVRKV